MVQTTRSIMVVIDDTPESRLALRFAARRAMTQDAHVALLHIVPPADFVQWGGVQQAIEAEAREKAEALLRAVADDVFEQTSVPPTVAVRYGKPTEEVKAALLAEPEPVALVLGAAAKGPPGPLVSFFTGEGAGSLPCPVVIVPGGMSGEAIDRLA